MSNNQSKGANKLAVVLQKRMKAVSKGGVSVSSELGTILAGNKLKLDSLPDAVLDDDDYLVCQTICETKPLEKGDRVLVIWTDDGETVVVDKLIAGDEI